MILFVAAMKTGVERVGRGKSREVNARFSSIVSHYLFDAQFCNPASDWEKGQIEKNVQDSGRRIWQRLPHFSSLEAINDWLADNFCPQHPDGSWSNQGPASSYTGSGKPSGRRGKDRDKRGCD